MRDIAEGEGDLTRRLPERGRSEIAELSRHFNRFTARIQNMVLDVSHASHQLSSDSSSLSTVAQRTAESMRQQAVETGAVAKTIHEMLDAVREVTQAAKQAVDAAQQADREAHAGGQVVRETIQAIDSVAQEVGRAGDVIGQLENDSRNIGTILDTIKGIADQTNLLALNAAIEAARAGEQGRGFAVVADEVRKLAQSTQDATTRIQHMIANLQNKAREAVGVMEEGRMRVSSSVAQAGQAGESLQKITLSVTTIKDMNGQIAASAAVQSEAADKISANISAIGRVADETSQGVGRTQEAVSHLAKLLAELQSMVGNFKTGDRKLDLSGAKSAHLNWKTRLRAFLDGKTTLTEAEAVSHQQCAFGKWYYSEGQRIFGHIPELRAVEEPHAELHRAVKEIIHLMNTGDRTQAERIYDRVDDLSRQIVVLLELAEAKA